jgi:hypothetical protein
LIHFTVAHELSAADVCSPCLMRLFVSQTKRCLLQRNLAGRFPCLLLAAATAVDASQRAADSASPAQRTCARLVHSSSSVASPRASTPSTCAPTTTPIRHRSRPLQRSGTDLATNTHVQGMHSTRAHMLTLLRAGQTCSCVCAGVCSRCSRTATPCTERYHQHLSTTPPHTSTPYSEQPICIY